MISILKGSFGDVPIYCSEFQSSDARLSLQIEGDIIILLIYILVCSC